MLDVEKSFSRLVESVKERLKKKKKKRVLSLLNIKNLSG